MSIIVIYNYHLFVAGYLVLVYQAIYYHWSFVADVNKSVDNFSVSNMLYIVAIRNIVFVYTNVSLLLESVYPA